MQFSKIQHLAVLPGIRGIHIKNKRAESRHVLSAIFVLNCRWDYLMMVFTDFPSAATM